MPAVYRIATRDLIIDYHESISIIVAD